MSMNADDLIAFLQQHYPDAFIQAANQGNKFDVRVVDASFEGKRSVQRQQAIYALVNDRSPVVIFMRSIFKLWLLLSGKFNQRASGI